MNFCFLFFVFQFLVYGQPQLRSSIRSLDLSGEQCPGILILTCDANFTVIDSINWWVDNERLAVFDANADSTPFTTTTSPDLLNATVQLTSAASVNNFLSLQGQNINCGSFISRSSSFEIGKFTLTNESSHPGIHDHLFFPCFF